jgi:hypothetical protein
MTEKEFPTGVFPFLDFAQEKNLMITHPLKSNAAAKIMAEDPA